VLSRKCAFHNGEIAPSPDRSRNKKLTNVYTPNRTLSFQSSLLAPLLFAHFLRLRFHLSSYTRGAFRDLNNRMDKFLLPPSAHPSIPPAVGHAYTTIKGYIIKYSQAGMQQAPPQPQPQ
jgi:Transmembrane protein 33/Nucleoporin POM33